MAKHAFDGRVEEHKLAAGLEHADAEGKVLDDGFETAALGLRLVPQGALAFGGRPAQAGEADIAFDAGDQFAGGEWFDQVVIGSGFEALDTRFLTGASGEQYDGHVAQVRNSDSRAERGAGRSRRGGAS